MTKLSVQGIIDKASAMLENVVDGSITGDMFGELFITDLNDSLAWGGAPVLYYVGLILLWPEGDIDKIHSTYDIYTPVSNAIEVTHNLGTSNVFVHIFNDSNELVDAGFFTYTPVDDNTTTVSFYGELLPRSFYKLIIARL
jgi:hypothetical protein